jgi:YlmC/YmxH family sporulation protein
MIWGGLNMHMKFSELRCKEVICVADGRRLGFVSDVEVEIPEGIVKCIIVPGPCRFFGIFGRKDDYLIPWSSIKRIGPDIILVDIQPNDCCVPRFKPGWL